MKRRHVHSMRPAPGRRTVYECASCAFTCTLRALPLVNQNPQQHHVVKPSDPAAREIWDGA